MELNEYQEAALKTRKYPMQDSNIIYPAIKLAGEAGEVADKIGKYWRNNCAKEIKTRYTEGEYVKINDEMRIMTTNMDSLMFTDKQRDEILSELGDVLWYIAAIAKELNVNLEKIARVNLIKLQDRLERDVIC